MTPVVQFVTNILSFGTVVCDVLILFLLGVILTPLSEKGWGKKVADFFGKHAILFSFLIAAGSVVGSLFYSEYAHFAPCELCWIERGFIYTQAIILAVAIIIKKGSNKIQSIKFDEFARKACLVLSGIDFPISAYHTYLQLGGAALAPCSAIGPSCEYVYFIQYGYVTIPSMALTAATLILLFMLFKAPLENN
jgi:disulfide bond formation protein DsbB